MSTMHSAGRLAAFAAALLLAQGVRADPGADPTEPPRPPVGSADTSEHAVEHHFVLGAKGSYLAAFSDETVHHLGGGGLFFELSLIPRWLELEYGVRAMTDGDVVAFPLDVLLKIPWHASEVVHPFLGIGPTFIPVFDEHFDAHAGAVVTAGTYLWAWPWGGFVVEANYNLVFADHVEHEVGPNAGFAYRW